jgi:hypothetical protein
MDYHLSFIKIRRVTCVNALINIKRIDIARDRECPNLDLVQKIRCKLPWPELGDVPTDDNEIRGMDCNVF